MFCLLQISFFLDRQNLGALFGVFILEFDHQHGWGVRTSSPSFKNV